jgi:hypothetical protein
LGLSVLDLGLGLGLMLSWIRQLELLLAALNDIQRLDGIARQVDGSILCP